MLNKLFTVISLLTLLLMSACGGGGDQQGKSNTLKRTAVGAAAEKATGVVDPSTCGSCTSDSDCGSGQRCTANEDCLSSCDCPNCAVCAGHCVDDGPPPLTCANVLCAPGTTCSEDCNGNPVCNPIVCEGFAGLQCEKGFKCIKDSTAAGQDPSSADKGGTCVKDCNGGGCDTAAGQTDPTCTDCGKCTSSDQCGSDEYCTTEDGACKQSCDCPVCDVCAGDCVPKAPVLTCANVLCAPGHTCSEDCDGNPVCNPVVCEGFAGLQCQQGFTCKLAGSNPDQGGECVKDCQCDASTTASGSCPDCGKCVSNNDCNPNEICTAQYGQVCKSWCDCPLCDVCAGDCVPTWEWNK